MFKGRRNNDKTIQFYDPIQSDNGYSLLSGALMILVIGLSTAAGIHLYNLYGVQSKNTGTTEKMEAIEGALQAFLVQPGNGRFPCPAPLDANIDSDEFGVEVTTDCTANDSSLGTGTFRATGRDGRTIRVGAIPVRTLNLPDELIIDNWNSRFVYAVTENEASAAAQPFADSGGIIIRDQDNSSSTSVDGNITHLIMSLGEDRNGAFNIQGNLVSACDINMPSGANCDFMVLASTDQDTGTFINTIDKSKAENNMMVSRISYAPSRTIINCEEADLDDVPLNLSILLDTSGSMMSPDTPCPIDIDPGDGTMCTKMQASHWAIRRIIPARLHTNSYIDEPGVTRFTGFTNCNDINCVTDALGDYSFDDPTADDYTSRPYDDLSRAIENTLGGMCPAGGTPLGIHMRALADDLSRPVVDGGDGDGGDDGDIVRPDKLTIISDGGNTTGEDPLSVADYIVNNPELAHLEIDILYVGAPNDTTETALREVVNRVGGTYYTAQNPDELLTALFVSAGVCGTLPPSPPADQDHCGFPPDEDKK